MPKRVLSPEEIRRKELKEKADAEKLGAWLHTIFFGALLMFVVIMGVIKLFGDPFQM